MPKGLVLSLELTALSSTILVQALPPLLLEVAVMASELGCRKSFFAGGNLQRLDDDDGTEGLGLRRFSFSSPLEVLLDAAVDVVKSPSTEKSSDSPRSLFPLGGGGGDGGVPSRDVGAGGGGGSKLRLMN